MLVGLEFLILALLGYCFVQLLQWDAAFQNNRSLLLGQLRRSVRRLRMVRKQLDQTGGKLPELPLPFAVRRKWQVVQWVGKALLAARLARS